MKTQSLLAGILLLAGASMVQAVPYTDIYDLSQGGYTNGGTVRGTVWITDADGDGLISVDDPIRGTLSLHTPAPNSRTNVSTFDVTGMTGPSLLSGLFSITGINHLGHPATITNMGGTAFNFDFPFTGQGATATTTQAPVITKRVPDEGATLPLLLAGLVSCRLIASRRH